MLDKELERTLNDVLEESRAQHHEFVTVEHLLLALLNNPSAVRVLKGCGVNFTLLYKELTKFISQNTPLLKADDEGGSRPTLGFQRVLQRAVFHVQSSGQKEVTGANVLVAIFGEHQSHAVYLLNSQQIARLDVVNYISHGIFRVAENEQADDRGETDDGGDEQAPFQQDDPLQTYTVNLNDQARLGKIDPLIGRQQEIQRTIQILCRRRKNNPLYVGEAGVGKTAIAEGLAKMIVDGAVPEVISESTIYSLELGSLLAGTKYRGDFEKRMTGMIEMFKKRPHSILFIDEIHTIIGAGAASGGVMDASNIIKPLLSSGDFRCIGSTTYQEFNGIFEKDRALARRFQKIDVVEPSVEETIQILQGLKPQFEDHHATRYTRQALRCAAELTARHIHDRHLPDKALDVIDEAGAYLRLAPAAKRKKVVGVGEIEHIVAKIARIPPRQVSAFDKTVLKNLARDLKMVVFNQDHAIDSLAAAIKMSRSGLGKSQQPMGVFLFAGPTGVGKTELARQLGQVMGISLLRFDMSEYMERHTVSRLIGAPPGYVGFDQGGLLTDEVYKNPHSVLLFDEMEKAHPDVFNLMLQVFDHGTLTDANGRKVDFRNTIIIMTTNAGADRISRASVGFTVQDNSSDAIEAIKKTFSPEFRNRLDSIIQFNSLDQKTIHNIVEKFLFELEAQLDKKKISLEVTEVAKRWLGREGYDPLMGARPMIRLIQEKIKQPLAEQVLFGELEQGGHLLISVRNKTLCLQVKGRKR